MRGPLLAAAAGVCVAAASALCGTTCAWAQTGGAYSLTWNSLDCGSPVTSTGGSYVLGGTTGQADAGVLSGSRYTLQGGFWQGSVAPTDAPPGDEPAAALSFRLHGNTPNPFAATTAILFTTASASDVQLRIYDLAGRVVRTVLDRPLGAGRHQVFWNGDDDTGRPVAKGIYFTRLRAGAFEAHRKLVVLR
jgi:hypothetical protein